MKKNTTIKLFLSSAVLFLVPLVSFARSTFNFGFGSGSGGYGSSYGYGTGSTITDIMIFMINLINQAVVIVVALALLFFFWGVAKFIFNADNVEKRQESKGVMMWGIIALFVMVFVWQIINILANTFF